MVCGKQHKLCQMSDTRSTAVTHHRPFPRWALHFMMGGKNSLKITYESEWKVL